MNQRDENLLVFGGGLVLLIMALRKTVRGTVTVDYDAGEASETWTPAKPAAKPSETITEDSPPEYKGGGGAFDGSGASGKWTDAKPAPIPDVESPPSREGLERINVATAELVLIKLGAVELKKTGVFNLDVAQAWQEAAIRLDPAEPGQGAQNLDPVFERASNTKVWIDRRTAERIAAAANAGRRVLAPDYVEPGDEDARVDPEVQKRAADQMARDALDAARRAAQAAAKGQGESGGQDLGVQEPVPAMPPNLPNPPPTPINLERARRTAPAVDKEIKAKRDKYNRKVVAQFQGDAGLVPDGLYGPVTQSALRYFGVKDPAKPVFKNKSYTAYQPPA